MVSEIWYRIRIGLAVHREEDSAKFLQEQQHKHPKNPISSSKKGQLTYLGSGRLL
jgi:hypothetical protein